jgi:hypothetical protein
MLPSKSVFTWETFASISSAVWDKVDFVSVTASDNSVLVAKTLRELSDAIFFQLSNVYGFVSSINT